MSPLYPEPYAAARQCIYEIEANPGKSVVLEFSDFALEGYSCDFDSITVRHASFFTRAHNKLYIFAFPRRYMTVIWI